MTDLIAPLRVAPGSEVRLSRDHDPGYAGVVARPQAAALLADGVELLADYQDRLAAQDTFGVLLVLQGLDAAGKDSTIKHVMSGVNPPAVEVRAFKQPSAEELNHDFLWRYQRALPRRGRIGIFNRSHYEEVLVVRVHEELLAAERMPAVARSQDLGPPLPRDRRLGRRTGSSPPATSGSGATGTTTSRPSRTCSNTPARSGRHGTSCRPTQMVQPPGHRRGPGDGTPRDQPQVPGPDPTVADQMAQVREVLAAELGRTGPG